MWIPARILHGKKKKSLNTFLLVYAYCIFVVIGVLHALQQPILALHGFDSIALWHALNSWLWYSEFLFKCVCFCCCCCSVFCGRQMPNMRVSLLLFGTVLHIKYMQTVHMRDLPVGFFPHCAFLLINCELSPISKVQARAQRYTHTTTAYDLSRYSCLNKLSLLFERCEERKKTNTQKRERETTTAMSSSSIGYTNRSYVAQKSPLFIIKVEIYVMNLRWSNNDYLTHTQYLANTKWCTKYSWLTETSRSTWLLFANGCFVGNWFGYTHNKR